MDRNDDSAPVQAAAEPAEHPGDEKSGKRNVPPALKLVENVVATGEKSPAPASVYDLFKKYHKGEKNGEENVNVNVGFDQLSSDEKSGFLRKLQMLTVGSKKKDGESSQSPAGRLLKKFVPSRRTTPTASASTAKTTSPSRFSVFGRSAKKVSESFSSQKPIHRKQSARRLQFTEKENPQPDAARNKVVAAMTREYEKLSKECAPVPINNKPARVQMQIPRGSLETPTDSPVKSFSSTTTSSSPEKEREKEKEKIEQPRYGTTQRQSVNSQQSSASWHGELPPRDYTSPTFSRKIFVGGVPWDITEAALKDSFGEFGSCAVEWPGQEARYRSGQSNVMPPNANLRAHSKYSGQATTGYVYMIFEDERAVAALLHECSQEIGGAGEWYFKIRAQRSKSTEIRQVQIIPWVTSDSLYCHEESILEVGIEPKRTVFVGALHGMMTAQVLHSIMEDCFGCVECVQLDTDKFKYPIGSGRVTFREHGAYFKAIEIGYLHVHTSKFRKRVQIDPFLESTSCMVCNLEPAHCFCRNRNCFKYYCHSCWSIDHGKDTVVDVHVPVIVPSSATKAYQGHASRHSHLSSNSPSKARDGQNSNNSQFSQLLSPAFPMIVGAPTPTLSALYGYIQNNHTMSPTVYDGPLTPPSSETMSKRGSREFSSNSNGGPVFISPAPVLSSQKLETPIPSYFANSTAILTPASTYYGSPSTQQTYYAPNVYYGYMPQPIPYDGYVCPPPANYTQ
uniref:Cytoplasmic polyadenylation element-binding protein 3 n=1 Tax=Caenorhabditis japonica TaxID=281687 RepID=A0A8R1I8I1_CAEJA